MGMISKFVKLGAVTLGAAVVIGACASQGTSQPVNKQENKVEKKQEAPKQTSKITQENFDKIVQGDGISGEGGMSVDEMKNILGKESNYSKIKSGEFEIETFGYSDLKTGVIITITITNGKVSGKSFTKM